MSVPETNLRELPDPRGLFDLIEVVGTGTYGEVYKGRHKKTGQLAAIKILDLIEDEEEEIKVEVDVLKQFQTHENITSFYGIYGVPVSDTLPACTCYNTACAILVAPPHLL